MARKRSLIILILVLSLSPSGCTLIFPKTADLNAIHDTYRTEFTNARLPTAKELQGTQPTGLDAGDFKQTLAAIADYRRKYPGMTKELNHLKILEGMIYLQTKQLGMAKLLAKEVQLAGGQLSSSQSAPRDSLFAETFGDLLNGWKTINDLETQDAPRSTSSTLVMAAENITKNLCEIKAANNLKIVQGDQGATYLATTAAIFYLWADHRAQYLCLVEQETTVCDRDYYPATHLDKGRDLVWEFMTPTGRQLAKERSRTTKGERVQGTPRFTEYYLLLEVKISDRAKKARAANRQGEVFTVTDRADACVDRT